MSISTCALREEGDCVMAFSSGVMRYFYPRPPRGRRRENIQCEAKLLAISIHALREEGDVLHIHLIAVLGISIHALREEGDCAGFSVRLSGKDISIHALREEGDQRRGVPMLAPVLISIHALREEGDAGMTEKQRAEFIFLSTPSARRATC